MLRTMGILLFALMISSCEKIALLSTPKKQAVYSKTQLGQHAERNFWHTLHQGNYNAIDQAIALSTAAYLQNPNDPQLAAHLGFLHIWKITERARLPSIPPTIVNEIILSKKYFHDATTLNPNDPRSQGFLGDAQLIEGQIFKDRREEVRGYFQLQRAIHQWPAFNYFTAGYPMSTLDPTSDHFKEGLQWQWHTLTLCAGTKMTANNPSFAPYLHRETKKGPLRACWNSWIAPHNFEGFFLNMGDMLVKNGNWETGIKIYRNAKLSKTYDEWPYKAYLEKRIQNAKENVTYFNQVGHTDKNRLMLFNSGYGCVACHQR